jgi:hypothetical protein
MELLFDYLAQQKNLDRSLVANSIWQDYLAGGRRDKPGFLKDYLVDVEPHVAQPPTNRSLPKRQARHATVK